MFVLSTSTWSSCCTVCSVLAALRQSVVSSAPNSFGCADEAVWSELSGRPKAYIEGIDFLRRFNAVVTRLHWPLTGWQTDFPVWGFTRGWTMGPSASWFYEGQLRPHRNWKLDRQIAVLKSSPKWPVMCRVGLTHSCCVGRYRWMWTEQGGLSRQSSLLQ